MVSNLVGGEYLGAILKVSAELSDAKTGHVRL